MNRSTTMPRTRASSACSAVALLALAGCAGYSPGDLRAGATEAELRARMGEPTGRYALPQGSLVEYARGPMGKHTYMVELDAAGRVAGWQQVLTEANFESVAAGAASTAVRQLLGRPSEARTGWRGVGEVWSYRYHALFCRWFQIWLVEGRVREASYAVDPSCDDTRRFPDE